MFNILFGNQFFIIMKQKSLLVLFIFFAIGLNAQIEEEFWQGESCTSIMVGCKASTDGSVMTAHTCDGNYRTWVRMEPAADYPDTAMHKVYKGTLKTETPWDMRGVTLAGEIPEAKHTYAYLNTAYPCMNEKQLGIGETTFSGPDTLVNKNGMFLIEELQRIALQRCDNARDAIRLIGELIKEYGYGDGGECITIADTKEVWQMEILGEGPDKIGGVWAAQRIPDNHVGISANICRIGKIDRNNEDYFMASENAEEVAIKMGLWDGEGDFIFWKAYAGREKPFMIREFFVLSTLAPSLNLSMDMAELPFSVKPEEKVDIQKITELYRETYEGTEYDMTKNVLYVKDIRDNDRKVIGKDTIVSPVANPWLNAEEISTLNYLKDKTVTFQRTVSVAWCSYSHVIQLRDWLPDEVGGICWFSVDNPGQSPRIPIFCGVSSLPSGFEVCGQKQFNENALLWQYKKANKLATVRWGKTKRTVLDNVIRFEEKVLEDLPGLETKTKELLKNNEDNNEVKQLLTRYTNDFAASTRQRWTELEHRFWEMFKFGF